MAANRAIYLRWTFTALGIETRSGHDGVKQKNLDWPFLARSISCAARGRSGLRSIDER